MCHRGRCRQAGVSFFSISWCQSTYHVSRYCSSSVGDECCYESRLDWLRLWIIVKYNSKCACSVGVRPASPSLGALAGITLSPGRVISTCCGRLSSSRSFPESFDECDNDIAVVIRLVRLGLLIDILHCGARFAPCGGVELKNSWATPYHCERGVRKSTLRS